MPIPPAAVRYRLGSVVLEVSPPPHRLLDANGRVVEGLAIQYLRVLEELVKQKGVEVTRRQLATVGWGSRATKIDRRSNVYTAIKALREQLGGKDAISNPNRSADDNEATYRYDGPCSIEDAAQDLLVSDRPLWPAVDSSRAARSTQPVLDRFEADRKNENDRSIRLSDLQFIRRATPYLPRPDIEEKIQSWLEQAASLSIVKLTGPAGAGKSRLALSLCDAFHNKGWLAGFVTNITRWPEEWIPIRPTLIVIDYASSKSIGALPLFDWLQRLRASEWRRQKRAPRVGVVLIDRTDQGPLWSAWRESPNASDFDELTLPIQLPSKREEFDKIAQAEFGRRTGRPLSADEREALDSVAERLHRQYRPLFALLTAAALTDVDDGGHTGLKGHPRLTRLQMILQALGLTSETDRWVPSLVRWSPELLVESILKGQLRQWRQAGVTDRHLDLLFEATVSAGTQVDPRFVTSVGRIAAPAYESVASLSEPSDTLGPIMPDLLGEFFVLMRLRGEAHMGLLLRRTARARSWKVLERTLRCTGTVPFLGLLLQDYLAWNPKEGDNPAKDIAERLLGLACEQAAPAALAYAAFAIAWRRPDFRDWAVWLQSVAAEHRLLFVHAIATGLANAALSAVDVVACMDSAKRIATIHGNYFDALVREHLAAAWCAAAMLQPHPGERLALAEQIQSLHNQYGWEPAVRAQLARAVCSCTFEESDRSRLAAFVDRLERLHTDFDEEGAVREYLAIALYNVCMHEGEPSQRQRWIERLQQLHAEHGAEDTVRVPLVRALCLASTGKADVAMRLVSAEALQTLHSKYPTEPLTRELLAEALYNITVKEPNPQKCLDRANQVEALYEAFGNESAIAIHLAGTLSNATAYSDDVAWVDARLETLWTLHNRHEYEAHIRDHLALALCNASAYGGADRRHRLGERIMMLHDAHGAEPNVRQYAAMAIYNITRNESNVSQSAKVLEWIDTLYKRGAEGMTAESLAGALRHMMADEGQADRWEALDARLSRLYNTFTQNENIRDCYAKAIFTAIEDSHDSERRAKLINRLAIMCEAHPEDDALAHHLNNARKLCA